MKMTLYSLPWSYSLVFFSAEFSLLAPSFKLILFFLEHSEEHVEVTFTGQHVLTSLYILSTLLTNYMYGK